MTLLLTVVAALVTTLVWYFKAEPSLKIGTLCLMYWGAALMWLVDAVVEYLELGVAYFEPTAAELLNDSYLGLSVVVLGLVIWLLVLLIQDPKGTCRAALKKK